MTRPTQITEVNIAPIDDTIDRSALDARLRSISWALFLIITGGIWLLPDLLVPEGLWLIGTGLILLGLNAARALNDIEMSGFTILMGLLILSAGLTDLMGVPIPVLPILLIGAGVGILLRGVSEQDRES